MATLMLAKRKCTIYGFLWELYHTSDQTYDWTPGSGKQTVLQHALGPPQKRRSLQNSRRRMP
jgi:hypothetical protein